MSKNQNFKIGSKRCWKTILFLENIMAHICLQKISISYVFWTVNWHSINIVLREYFLYSLKTTSNWSYFSVYSKINQVKKFYTRPRHLTILNSIHLHSMAFLIIWNNNMLLTSEHFAFFFLLKWDDIHAIVFFVTHRLGLSQIQVHGNWIYLIEPFKWSWLMCQIEIWESWCLKHFMVEHRQRPTD